MRMCRVSVWETHDHGWHDATVQRALAPRPPVQKLQCPAGEAMSLPEAALAWPRWRLLVAIIGPVRAQRAVEDEVDEPDEEEGVDDEE